MLIFWTLNLDGKYYSYIIVQSHLIKNVWWLEFSPLHSFLKKKFKLMPGCKDRKWGDSLIISYNIQKCLALSLLQIPQNSQESSYIHWKKSELIHLGRLSSTRLEKNKEMKFPFVTQVAMYCPFLPILSSYLGPGNIWERKKWQIGTAPRVIGEALRGAWRINGWVQCYSGYLGSATSELYELPDKLLCTPCFGAFLPKREEIIEPYLISMLWNCMTWYIQSAWQIIKAW